MSNFTDWRFDDSDEVGTITKGEYLRRELPAPVPPPSPATCEVCGERLRAKRKRAKTCSWRCALAAIHEEGRPPARPIEDVPTRGRL